MATRIQEAFGQHLVIDGYGGPRDRLCDLDLIYRFLDETPDLIRMTKIMPPYVFKYHGKVPEDWGLSGFVLIAESHISIHTFPERAYLSLDIFSCKDFDDKLALDHAVGTFGIASYERHTFDRGLEFPRNPQAVKMHLCAERSGIS